MRLGGGGGFLALCSGSLLHCGFAQDSRRHPLGLQGQELITSASSQLMEWEISARAEVARSQLCTKLWCSLICWPRVLLVCHMYV